MSCVYAQVDGCGAMTQWVDVGPDDLKRPASSNSPRGALQSMRYR
jgi:hypothetical protein